jgi:hypothetical protein
MKRWAAGLLAIGVMASACSNPPASVSPYVMAAERRDGGIWVSLPAGALNGPAGVHQVRVTVYAQPERTVVAQVVLDAGPDRSVPATQVYRLPEGDRRSYAVAVYPVNPSGGESGATFDVPAP